MVLIIVYHDILKLQCTFFIFKYHFTGVKEAEGNGASKAVRIEQPKQPVVPAINSMSEPAKVPKYPNQGNAEYLTIVDVIYGTIMVISI